MSTSAHPPEDGPGAAGADAPVTRNPRTGAGASGGDPSWRPDEDLVRRVRQEIAAAAAAAASRSAGVDGPPDAARASGRAAVLPPGGTLRGRSGHGRSALAALAALVGVAVARAVATGSRSGGRHGEDRPSGATGGRRPRGGRGPAGPSDSEGT